jgi:hypothetical protein
MVWRGCGCAAGVGKLADDGLGVKPETVERDAQERFELFELLWGKHRKAAVDPLGVRRDHPLAHTAAFGRQHDAHVAAVAAFAWHALRPAEVFELIHNLGDIALVTDQEAGQLCHRAAIIRLQVDERPEMRDGEGIIVVVASIVRAGGITPDSRHWREGRKKALIARVHLDERLREQMIDRVCAVWALQSLRSPIDRVHPVGLSTVEYSTVSLEPSYQANRPLVNLAAHSVRCPTRRQIA